MRLLIFSIFLSTALICHSQKITGRVICSDHGRPVANAIVTLTMNNGVNFPVKTDSLGSYAFNLNGTKATLAEVRAETDKLTKCPSSAATLMSNEVKYRFVPVADSVYIFNFRLNEAQACGWYYDFRFKKNSVVADTIFGQYNGRPDTITEEASIEKLAQVLIANPSIVLEISGHCSSNEKNTEHLSKQRAEKIRSLLVKKGVNKDRLQTVGYGIRKLKIPDAQVKKVKTASEKEQLHANNRRVVFRVISWDYNEKDEQGK